MTDLPLPKRRLATRLRLARAALSWERAWPNAWPALCVLGLLAVAALFDVLPLLGGPAHAGILALFALAFAGAVVWGLRAAGIGAWPDRIMARRRIEQASGLAHRPLEALGDRPSGPLDGPAAALYAPIEFVQKNPNTVQALTNAIIRASLNTRKVIEFLDGHGEADIDDSDGQSGFGAIKKDLEGEGYE